MWFYCSAKQGEDNRSEEAGFLSVTTDVLNIYITFISETLSLGVYPTAKASTRGKSIRIHMDTCCNQLHLICAPQAAHGYKEPKTVINVTQNKIINF